MLSSRIRNSWVLTGFSQTAYDPTTSTEPLPPSMQEAKPSTYPLPSGSTSDSRHSATSQTWVEVSGSPSSAEDLSPPATASGFASGEEMMSVSRSSNRTGQALTDLVPKEVSTSGLSQADTRSTAAGPSRTEGSGNPPQSHQTPPAQPPSLTLSLFTSPSHLTMSRIIAVIGINLVLPFVNGVMLGFGEIFAREVVKVGKVWWRAGGSLLRSSQNRYQRSVDDTFAGGRGVAGVGLSGSGGFP